jgi:hypothetical protein
MLPPAAPEVPPRGLGGGRFRLSTAAGHGHFGEVWHAQRADEDEASGDGLRFVLKRAPAASGAAARAAAHREAHFGRVMAGARHAARFVEAFSAGAAVGADDGGNATMDADADAWLVFVDEGVSLAALMYSDGADAAAAAAAPRRAAPASSLALLAPSAWWRQRRATMAGTASLRAVWAGVLSALAEAHGRGVAHRDVKPGNVLLSQRGDGDASLDVRLCDWGSAVDAEALAARLYGANGPGAGEETPGYAPPEARFGGDAWPGRINTSALFAYDVWSAGVLGLELLVMGTPDVFAPPARAAAAAARAAAAAGLTGAARDALLHLRGLAALCIAPPAQDGGGGGAMATDASCSERALLASLRARDPAAASHGVPLSPWALRLLRRMLAWDSRARPNAARALQHAFFAAPQHGAGFPCAGGHPDAEWPDDCPAGAA